VPFSIIALKKRKPAASADRSFIDLVNQLPKPKSAEIQAIKALFVEITPENPSSADTNLSARLAVQAVLDRLGLSANIFSVRRQPTRLSPRPTNENSFNRQYRRSFQCDEPTIPLQETATKTGASNITERTTKPFSLNNTC
jgi:hypothetical protein